MKRATMLVTILVLAAWLQSGGAAQTREGSKLAPAYPKSRMRSIGCARRISNWRGWSLQAPAMPRAPATDRR